MTVRDQTDTKGSILIFTLWVLVCLTLISLGFGHRVRLETKATGYTVANAQAFYKAESALYEKALELIAEREKEDAEPARTDESDDGEQEWDVRISSRLRAG
jgi:Tfp pilus assembly protein PilX